MNMHEHTNKYYLYEHANKFYDDMLEQSNTASKA